MSFESAGFLCFPFFPGGGGATSVPLGVEPSARPLTLLGIVDGSVSRGVTRVERAVRNGIGMAVRQLRQSSCQGIRLAVVD